MAKAILLAEDLESGEKLLRRLEAERFPVSAAFWRKDESGWQYHIVSPLVDRKGLRAAYETVSRVVLNAAATQGESGSVSLSSVTVNGLDDVESERALAVARGLARDGFRGRSSIDTGDFIIYATRPGKRTAGAKRKSALRGAA
jgi:hypothetical protein